ncbi:MarR family transcriptional regulator [Streptomyces sp. NBC_01005]|uniref:MarR family transcriptional regulator n=1 Tax=unclassified Streptomyces TaxID=2593676 RepID=UPI00386B0046|nr:MarR family transcriptional regulator [Streptomyces sp. NBC_01005]WTC95722.1 MarR family transcriptional regulator [Streptomyces sp. NBC_01650]
MAAPNLSPALRAPASSRAHPKAKPGYGKRSVPKQRHDSQGDFTLLPERERHIAGYVDALPEGAAMDIKSLARSQPLYGQMAVGSALRALGVAGHLRHVRCLSGEGDQVRWVTRTFWSRTAHDNEWWTAFLAAEEHHPAPQGAAETTGPDAPGEAPEPEPAPKPAPVPVQPPALVVPQQRTAAQAPTPVHTAGDPSPAFAALARLGRTDSRLALSGADCAALEQAAAEWFARGVDADYLTHALTAGLPVSVDSPFGFVRRRLRDKLPPRLPATTPATQATPVRRLMVECTECGAPGRPEAFRDGLCRPCRELDPA